MQRYIDYLPGGSVWFRILAAASCLLVTVLLCWWRLAPAQLSLKVLELDYVQARRQVVAQQKAILAVPAFEPLPESAASVPFSVLEAVKASGGKLVKWQPGPPQAMLELLLPWPRVPGLFQQLATYRQLRLQAFTLSAAGEKISVALSLELADEDR